MPGRAPSPGAAADAGRHRGNDALRGLAILAVVLTHTTAEWAAFPPGNPVAATYRSIRPALEIWIPLFLIVSGYYAGRVAVDSRAAYGSYLARRLRRIIPPYLLWATILFALGVAAGAWRVSDYAAGIVNGRFAYPYYFVAVLTKFIIACPVIVWALRSPAGAALSFIAAGAIWFYGGLPDDPLGMRSAFPSELLFRRTVHAEWAVFFVLGVFLRLRCRAAHQGAAPSPALPSVTVAVVACFAAIAGIVAYGRILPGHAVGIAGVLLFLGVNTPRGERLAARGGLLAALGANSYAIYLLHEPWLQWTKNLLGATASERPLLAQVPLVVVALAAPLAIRWCAVAVLGSRAAWVTG
jgi:peptidoglycan/LPS O-acetylase OafA/YrhL